MHRRVGRIISRKHQISRRARVLLVASVAGLLAPVVSAALADSSGTLAWLADLASHWQWLYAAGLVLGSALASLDDRRWALAMLVAPLPWLTAAGPAPLADAAQLIPAEALSVASANVNLDNRDPAALLRWLSKTVPDVVVLHEVSGDYAEKLNDAATFPYRYLAPADNPFGVAVLSRLPLVAPRIVTAEDGIGHVEAQVEWNGRLVWLATFHPMPPFTPRDHHIRNRKLESMARGAAASGQPALIVGDLNATPWSSAFTALEPAGFRRATGLAPTWPAIGRGWLGIPIDHILVSSHWSVVERESGALPGSDHLPVYVRITARRQSPGQ